LYRLLGWTKWVNAATSSSHAERERRDEVKRRSGQGLGEAVLNKTIKNKKKKKRKKKQPPPTPKPTHKKKTRMGSGKSCNILHWGGGLKLSGDRHGVKRTEAIARGKGFSTKDKPSLIEKNTPDKCPLGEDVARPCLGRGEGIKNRIQKDV